MPTLAEVTPPIAPAEALTSLESGTVALFERCTRSVVNVVDVTVLSGKAMTSGAVVPEGNGTGFVWDSDGHVVTNWHAIGSILSQVPRPRSGRGREGHPGGRRRQDQDVPGDPRRRGAQ